MPRHRFEVGQKVMVPIVGLYPLVPPGPYVVVHLLPIQDGEPGYHVRSEVDGRERALVESRIRALPSEPPTPPDPNAAAPRSRSKSKLRTGAI